MSAKKPRKFFFALLFLLSAVGSLPVTLLAKQTIRVGVRSSYPPYEWVDSKGQPMGFNVDLLRAIGQTEGLDLGFQPGEPNELKQKLLAGEIDVIAGLLESSEEELRFDFSNPHSVVSHLIFVWEEEKSIHTLENLKGRTVLAVRGGLMHDYLLSKRMGIYLTLTRNVQEALELLSAHRGQAAVVPRYPGLHYVKELGLENVKAVGRLLQPVEFCFAVREGNKELLGKLNRGLAAAKGSGEYDRIRRQWLGSLELKKTLADFLPVLVAASVGISALLLALWFWNWVLQKEVRRKTEELRIANEQLQRIGEFKTQIVSSVAHEFKTPLAVIQGYIDYLLDGSVGPLAKEQRTIGQKVEKVVSKLSRLVIDLLDVAKLETGKIKLDIKEIEALPMIDEVASIFQEQVASNGIALVKKVNPPDLVFRGDRARLEECLINLVDNAIKYSPDGGEIELSVFGGDQSVRFEVSDTGIGIPEKEMSKIFERFERFQPNSSTGGFGLGLAITRDFVGLHGGRIWAEKRPDRGSKFVFEIPKNPTV